MKTNFRDYQFCNGLRVCGCMNPSTSEPIITPNRIKSFQQAGIIEKVPYQDKHLDKSKSQYAYRLTEHGKKFCKKEFGMKHFAANKGSERHNCELYKQYSRLEPIERTSCMNELDIKDHILRNMDELIRNQATEELDKLLEQTQSMSLIDMAYTKSDGTFVGVEVATSNYSQEKIEAKEECATLIQCQEFHIVDIK